MKMNGLLAAAVAVFALTNQTVHAAEDVDVVVLRCDIFGTPREQRVVTNTRSVGAGTPSAILDNCAQVLGDLLAAGFTNEETLGTDGGGVVHILPENRQAHQDMPANLLARRPI